MDLELKEFEEKINSITEQFMSLLDSNDVIESSFANKLENGSSTFKEQSNHIIKNQQEDVIDNMSTSIFKLGTDNIKFGGIRYSEGNEYENNELPKHAVKFDSVEQMDLNNQLEKLYEEKRSATKYNLTNKPSIAFSDSNLCNANCVGNDAIDKDCTKIQTNSTFYNKEVYDMSNYCEEPKKENVFYSFATIPEDKALVERKNWKDILFMDIPWDTKIDVWGGIKKFCNIQVKFTA